MSESEATNQEQSSDHIEPEQQPNKPGQTHLIGIGIGVVVLIIMFSTLGGKSDKQTQAPIQPIEQIQPTVETSAQARQPAETVEKTEPAPTPAAEPVRTMIRLGGTTEEGDTFLVPSDSSGPPWALNLSSVSTRESAQHYVDEIKAQGYEATVANVDIDGRLWFRVRIEGFGTVREANNVAETFATFPNFQSMWVGGY